MYNILPMSSYPALLSPLMDTTGKIDTLALNDTAQLALGYALADREDVIVLNETTLRLKGDPATYTGDAGFNMVIDGNVKSVSVSTDTILAKSTMPNYPVSFGCPIGMNNNNIENVNGVSSNNLSTNIIYTNNPSGFLEAPATDFKTHNVKGVGNLNSNRCTANILNTDNTLNVINQARDGYHTITANESGLDVNTKFSTDGLILHKVDAGSDIYIQNDANNLVSIGTESGYADLQVRNVSANQITTSEKVYFGPNAFISSNYPGGDQLYSDSAFTVRNVQATNGMSIYNTTDYLALFEADIPSNNITCYTDGKLKGFGEFESKVITATNTAGTIIKNIDSSFTVDASGNTKVNELTYTSLNPPIAPTPTPTLGQVMTEGNTASTTLNMNNNNITNVLTTSTRNISGYQGSLTCNDILLIPDTNDSIIVGDLQNSYSSITGTGSIYGSSSLSTSGSIIINGSSGNPNAMEFNKDSGILRMPITLQDPAIFPRTNTITLDNTTGDIYTKAYHTQVGDVVGQAEMSSDRINVGECVNMVSDNIVLPGGALYSATGASMYGFSTGSFINSISVGDNIQVSGYTLLKPDGIEGLGLDGVFQSSTLSTTATTGTVIKNTDSSFTVDYQGNAKVNELIYTSLNPPIPPTPTSSLSEVLAVGNDGSNQAITNVSSINGIVPQYIPAQEYWVSKSGSNSNIGSLLNPYLTIQKALDVIATFTDGLPRVINILQGAYNENLSITKSRVSLLGQNPAGNRADTGCSINGTLTINCTADNTDMNNNNIYICNLQINGGVINTSSTKNRLSLANCNVYGNSQVVNMNNTSDYRFFANNTTFSNESTVSTDEMLLFSGSGMVSITNCQLTTKSLGNVIHFNGTSRVDTFANNILTSDSTSGNAQAILKISSTSTKSVGNCAFIYSSSTSKSVSSPNFSCGILINTPVNSNSVLTLVNNIFSLAGTSAGNAVNAVNAGSSIILFGNNTSTSSPLGATASAIVGTLNVNKFALTAVN